MTLRTTSYRWLGNAGGMVAATVLACTAAIAHEQSRDVLILTSTNATTGNSVAVFKLDTSGSPALTLQTTLPTGGVGGAGGNAGILQFKHDFGAVANYGSNTVTRLVRHDDYISLAGSFELASGCTQPVSVALANDHVFVAGANCAESHFWSSGHADGLVKLPDSSAGQIAIGRTWGAVTLKSGALLQLPLTPGSALSGASATVTLPATANDTPLGAEFWGDILGFTPAHSPDSFAIVNGDRELFPITGPAPAFPANAPCWVAKGPGNVWYTGNTPGHAISIFFSGAQGGVFYKSLPLPGAATDIAVSADQKLLAVIYTASNNGYVAVYSIDSYGDLTLVATSSAVGAASFNGVSISE
jgi:hypothetical protein